MSDDTFDMRTLTDLAIMHHEAFLSYVAAGFTEAQALAIVIAWIQKPASS